MDNTHGSCLPKRRQLLYRNVTKPKSQNPLHMRNNLKQLASILISSFLLVALLYLSSFIQLRSKNNFIRLFPPAILGERKAISLHTNAYTFIGKFSDTLVLGNRLSPYKYIKVPINTVDTLQGTFSWIPRDILPFYWNLSLQDSHLVASNTLTGQLLQSTYPFDSVNKSLQLHQPIQTSIPLSTSCLIGKTFDSKLNTRSIVKYLSNETNPDHSFIPWKQQEGIYSPDGFLLFNNKWNRLLYIHHYVNRIESLDTNLNKIETSSTIDLEDTLPGKVITEKKDSTLVQRLEGSSVNHLGSTDNDYLLVISKRLAKNQSLNQFNSNSTFDVYQLPELNYKFSFHVPLPNRETIHSIDLNKNYLYLLLGEDLIRYRLFFPIQN